MTPDEETVTSIHEGGLALAKVHQVLSFHYKADVPMSLSKKEEKALAQLQKLSDRAVQLAGKLPIASRRKRG